MALTELQCKNAKPAERPYKLADSGGLYLLVNTNGSRWWRLKYRFTGKEKLLALGVYPSVSLASARLARDEAKKTLASGVCPSGQRRTKKLLKLVESENTFKAVAQEWYDSRLPNWAPATASKVKRYLENDIYPWLGSQPIKEIGAPELLATVRRVESRGALELAHRIREYSGQVFRYAVATGRAERDPSADLRGALPPVKTKHHASVTDPKAIGELLRAINGYTGSFITKCALQLAPLVFVRPGELRHAEWSEIDLDAKEWRIPGLKMKMRDRHVVPLSSQAVEILEAIKPLTGHGKYVFPSNRTSQRPMSENTVNAALRRLGYEKNEMTGHGFRSMASTLLHEQGWPHEAIERQLAHAERNAVSAAYNYAQHLPKRKEMMQAWADYLDGLKSGAKVVPIGKVA
jgi:integrase